MAKTIVRPSLKLQVFHKWVGAIISWGYAYYRGNCSFGRGRILLSDTKIKPEKSAGIHDIWWTIVSVAADMGIPDLYSWYRKAGGRETK